MGEAAVEALAGAGARLSRRRSTGGKTRRRATFGTT
jgi:hypothetical protein